MISANRSGLWQDHSATVAAKYPSGQSVRNQKVVRLGFWLSALPAATLYSRNGPGLVSPQWGA